jgi:hypothetical protein
MNGLQLLLLVHICFAACSPLLLLCLLLLLLTWVSPLSAVL